jgi:endonuclease YncB( thermonuclease family)
MKKFTAKAAALTVAVLTGLPLVSTLTADPGSAPQAVSSVLEALAPKSAAAKVRRPSYLQNQTVRARVLNVHDGDSITVMTADGRKLKVRLIGIDTPEIGQPYASESRDALRRMVAAAGNRVELVYQKTDRYKRTLALVIANDRYLNHDLIRGGWAWYYRQYRKDLEAVKPGAPVTFAEAERYARSHRLGLWRDPAPKAPWDWRKEKRRRK